MKEVILFLVFALAWQVVSSLSHLVQVLVSSEVIFFFVSLTGLNLPSGAVSIMEVSLALIFLPLLSEIPLRILYRKTSNLTGPR